MRAARLDLARRAAHRPESHPEVLKALDDSLPAGARQTGRRDVAGVPTRHEGEESRFTADRSVSALAPACAHHNSRSHSRWFWGRRLDPLAAPDGTPRAAMLASADQKERDVPLSPRAGACVGQRLWPGTGGRSAGSARHADRAISR
jgi:hypothetical protein